MTPAEKSVFFHQTEQSLAFTQKQEVTMDPTIILLKTIRKRPTNHGRRKSYGTLVFQHSKALNYNPNSGHVVFMLTSSLLKEPYFGKISSFFILFATVIVSALTAKTTHLFNCWFNNNSFLFKYNALVIKMSF